MIGHLRRWAEANGNFDFEVIAHEKRFDGVRADQAFLQFLKAMGCS